MELNMQDRAPKFQPSNAGEIVSEDLCADIFVPNYRSCAELPLESVSQSASPFAESEIRGLVSMLISGKGIKKRCRIAGFCR